MVSTYLTLGVSVFQKLGAATDYEDNIDHKNNVDIITR